MKYRGIRLKSFCILTLTHTAGLSEPQDTHTGLIEVTEDVLPSYLCLEEHLLTAHISHNIVDRWATKTLAEFLPQCVCLCFNIYVLYELKGQTDRNIFWEN